MYCSNCGKAIPNESAFCPECGNKCSYEDEKNTSINITTPNMDIKKQGSRMVAALTKPVETMKNGLEGLLVKTSAIYIVLITLLIPVIKVVSLRFYSFSLVKSFMNISASLSGEFVRMEELVEIKQQFNMILQSVFPTGKLYFLNLISYMILYGIIILVIYFIYKGLIKEDINVENISNILFVFSIVQLVTTIVASILLIFGGIPWLIVTMIGSIISIILIYVGFNSVLEDKNKLVYLFSCTYLIAIYMSVWVVVKNIFSIFYQIGFPIEKLF